MLLKITEWRIQFLMNSKRYELFVKKGASEKYDNKLAIIGLVGEVGELADVVKKEAIYADMSKFEKKYGMSVKDKILDEAGDVMWQFTLVLIKYNITLEEVMTNNYNKLINRHKGIEVSKDGGKR